MDNAQHLTMIRVLANRIQDAVFIHQAVPVAMKHLALQSPVVPGTQIQGAPVQRRLEVVPGNIGYQQHG
jgi:hypothetical protein